VISIEQFIESVTSVHREKSTGRLRVGLRMDGKLRFATLFFDQGQLLDCEAQGQYGKTALNDLLDRPLVSSVFIRGEIPADTKNSTVPDVGAFIESARDRMAGEAVPAFDPDELIEITVDALRAIFGKRADRLVANIVAEFPPQKSAEVFLQECNKLAAEFSGSRKADSLFEPLFALVRNPDPNPHSASSVQASG